MAHHCEVIVETDQNVQLRLNIENKDVIKRIFLDPLSKATKDTNPGEAFRLTRGDSHYTKSMGLKR